VVLSKRERYIVAVTIIAVSMLVLDRYALTPLLERRARIEAEKQDLVRQMESAKNQFARRRQIEQKWQDMLAAGLKRDASEAESQVLHAVRNWSQESGLTLSSVKPERVAREGDLREVTFQAAGTGSMRSVAQFLWRLETASLPLKVKEMQLGSRKEGSDDLSLQLRISALYLPTEQEPSRGPSASQAPRGGAQ